MPNIKSAKKRMKTSEVSRVRNKAVKSRLASERTNLLQALKDSDKAKSETLSRSYTSLLDKAVKKGIISLNAASRRKARIDKKLTAIA